MGHRNEEGTRRSSSADKCSSSLTITSEIAGRSAEFESQHRRPKSANRRATKPDHSPADASKTETKLEPETALLTILANPDARLPVSSHRIIIPKEYTSDFAVKSPV
ncbi:hypothetical protein HanRHA438_Chr06g0269391 [Helianthus annuus]|nr:hypothetical protein HanRHA438_Chr06g0269391 [Helianthus annuus]